jgi:hypothetical protein
LEPYLVFAKLFPSFAINLREKKHMRLTKRIAAATIITISLVLLAFPSTALILQTNAQPTASNPREQQSQPLPTGVTANITVDTLIFLSFRPNPIGVGQTLLVNLWFNPPTHYNRILTGISVVLTKPDGTKDTKSGIVTYGGDATAWFEYTPDQIGTWKLQCIFPGGYFPAGYVAGGYAEPAQRWLDSAYYKPASTAEQTLTVQSEQIMSWPPSALPTDYWTRPVSPENREWDVILGSYPYTGTMANPPANTNPYASNYRYTPYVQAPNTAHIAWMRQGAFGGLLGGDNGQYSMTSGGGTPSDIFCGRCYQSITRASTSGTSSQTYWQCYDLRTGQVYWEIPMAVGQSAPTTIHYDSNVGEVPGAEADIGETIYFVSITSPSGGNAGRIIYYSPYTGAVANNVTGPPTGVTAGTLFADPYVYSIQTISGQYRLIEWDITRNIQTQASNMVTQMGLATDNFTARIISNITWPWSSVGTCDYQAGLAAQLSSSLYPNLGAIYGTRIQVADLKTGQLLWNNTDTDTCESFSELVLDHGKVACAMQGRHWNCYDGRTGTKLWTSELTGYPWGDWWAYSVASYGGNIIGDSYDAIYAFNWDTGKISWRFEAPANPYESPYVDPNGTAVNPFFTSVVIADGKVFAYNSEHTASEPITRGWKLFAINATNGQGIWNITGSMSPGAMADGYLTASNTYDGYMYVFGKGKSATTVAATPSVITENDTVLIQGTVLDQSPAQPGTPCVSEASMTTYMEYLHMQKPIPSGFTVTGVPVMLLAIDSNGGVTSIGTTASDMSGKFAFAWTPPAQGTYRITATFAGDKSYGSSWDETAVSVGPAPQQNTSQPQTASQPDYSMTIIAGIVAVIIAVAISTVLILRKK